MSIEEGIVRLASAIESLAAATSRTHALLERQMTAVVAAPVVAPVAMVQTAVAAQAAQMATQQSPKTTGELMGVPAPSAIAQAAQAPVAAPAMPAPPTFVSPPPAAPTVPFSDQKGLTEYAMAKYQALGAERGAKIFGVLQGMGLSALTDVQPAQYAAFFQGVEAL